MTSGPFTLITLDARKQLDDRLADLCELCSEFHEYLCCNAFALTNQAEEDVFGADVVVTELERLAQREFENLLRPWCERNMSRGGLGSLSNYLHNLGAHRLEIDVEAFERTGSNPFTLMDESKEDVFGTDVVVVQEARFLLSQYDDPAGSVCKTLEHVRYPLYGCGAPITGAPRGV